MATLPNSRLITTTEAIESLVALPFQALWRMIVWLAENNGRTKRLEQLNAISDEELAAKGLTRAEAARLTFGYEF